MRIRQSSAPGRIILAAAAAALLASCGSDDWADGTLQSAVAASISIDGTYASDTGDTTEQDITLTLDGTTFVAKEASANIENLVTVLVRKTDGKLATDNDVKVKKVMLAKDVAAGSTTAAIKVQMEAKKTMIDGIFVVSVDGSLLTSRKTVSGSGGSVKIGESYVTGEPLTLNANENFTYPFTIVGVGTDSYSDDTITVKFYDEAGNLNDDVKNPKAIVSNVSSDKKRLEVTVSGEVEEKAFDATGYISFTVPGFNDSNGKPKSIGSGKLSRSTYRINGIHAALDLPTGAEVASAPKDALVTVINLARLNTALSTIPAADKAVATGTIGSKSNVINAMPLPGATTTRIPVYFEDVNAADIASGGVELTIVGTTTNGKTTMVQQKTCENIVKKSLFWKDFEKDEDATEAEVFAGLYSGTNNTVTGEDSRISEAYETTVPTGTWTLKPIANGRYGEPNKERYVPVLFREDNANGRYVTVAQKWWSLSTITLDAEENEKTDTNYYGRYSNGLRVAYETNINFPKNFVLSFDLKLCNGNDQASAFYVGSSKDPTDNAANALLGFAATAAAGTAWKVNGSYLEVKLPHSADWSNATDGSAITSLPWYTVMLKYKGGEKGYLTLTDKATGEPLTDQFGTAITDTEIPVPSDVSKLGNIVFDSGRYYANFAIDNIAVLEVTPSIGR